MAVFLLSDIHTDNSNVLQTALSSMCCVLHLCLQGIIDELLLVYVVQRNKKAGEVCGHSMFCSEVFTQVAMM